jgi:uncharacterized membrane protein
MPIDTFLLIAAQYDSQDAAIADYDAVKDFYHESDLIDTFDAAVITKDADGKVRIVKRHEQPTRDAAKGGLGVGLAVGALVALFPAVGLGAGLLLGGAAGAGVGAVAGHAAAGLSRSDLKELGELLDAGQSGFLLVAASDLQDKLEKAIKRADKQVSKELRADPDAVSAELATLA